MEPQSSPPPAPGRGFPGGQTAELDGVPLSAESGPALFRKLPLRWTALPDSWARAADGTQAAATAAPSGGAVPPRSWGGGAGRRNRTERETSGEGVSQSGWTSRQARPPPYLPNFLCNRYIIKDSFAKRLEDNILHSTALLQLPDGQEGTDTSPLVSLNKVSLSTAARVQNLRLWGSRRKVTRQFRRPWGGGTQSRVYL